ncbi:MAG TPA: hypothetical protein VFM29_00045, partial [Vicinamibacteria bacterium]|nr:hypothetical protein [Vicinamibacteria bacterium]
LPSGHPPVGGMPAGHPPLGAPAAAANDPRAISGTVELGPKAGSAAGGVLYVIARGKDGQIQAVQREEVKSFPVAFRVGPADAMTAGTPFAGPFEVTARLSKTGDAIPGPGDLEGTRKGIAPGAKDVTIVLDTVRR